MNFISDDEIEPDLFRGNHLITDEQCHFVIGSPQYGEWHYCGKPIIRGGSTSAYCKQHYDICYGPYWGTKGVKE